MYEDLGLEALEDMNIDIDKRLIGSLSNERNNKDNSNVLPKVQNLYIMCFSEAEKGKCFHPFVFMLVSPLSRLDPPAWRRYSSSS